MPEHLTLNVYPASSKPSKHIDPLANYRAGIRAARRMGYNVGDAEVPHGWHESGSGPGNSNPDTTTLGGGTTPGMKIDLVASFPLKGAQFIYVPVTDPNGDWRIFKKDMQSANGMPEMVGGPYPAGDDAFLWSDMTSTAFRVWRTQRQRAATDDMSTLRAGRARSADGALGVSSRTWEQGGKNRDTGEGQEASGVGAESWVGGRKNTTGYVISAADARASIKRRLGRLKARRTADVQDPPLQSQMDQISARLMRSRQTNTSDSRPGLVQGSNSAKLVARRVTGIQQINEANRKAWS
jgi:hypothetical protein